MPCKVKSGILEGVKGWYLALACFDERKFVFGKKAF
jgi:hypothetical protein